MLEPREGHPASWKHPEEKIANDLLPGMVASVTCKPEAEGSNTDSALWPEMDQMTHQPCDWIFSFPSIIVGEGLWAASVRQELLSWGWVLPVGGLNRGSWETAKQSERAKRKEGENIPITTQLALEWAWNPKFKTTWGNLKPTKTANDITTKIDSRWNAFKCLEKWFEKYI